MAYYLSPAEKGGEPPGRWRGDGLPELGLQDGQIIDRETFERLYGHFLDPRDPDGQTRLGRRPQRFRSAPSLEPEATAERGAELLIEAKTQVRLPVQYFDVTFSVSKSITLLHASAMANAAQTETARDERGVAYWHQAAADIWACIEKGNQAALEYLQREAGYTRSGYHGRQVNGVTTGRWEDAHRFVIGSFPQHTSRDGDPQLHIHNLVLNRVQRERDGAWRTLDSKALFEHRGAASAIAALVMESALSREFGVQWLQRPDGHGREINGVSRALMDQFSSRRQSISALTGRLAREFEAQHGFAPDARALGKLRQWANHASRARKGAEPLDLTAEVRRWAAQARAGEAGALEPLLPKVSSRRGARTRTRPEPRAIFELTPEQERDLMTLALATLQESQPAWRKADLIRCLGELFPDNTVCRDDQSAAALLENMAGRVIAGAAGEHVVTLTAPEWPVVPQALRRADGRSVYLTLRSGIRDYRARRPGPHRRDRHVLADGLGHRQWLYVAMSRGWRANYAYCVTRYPRLADPKPGSLPAPELARALALALETAGLHPAPGQAAHPDPGPASDQEQHRDPPAVLADIVQRDGAVLSATEALRSELANADHLGVLASIWYDLTRRGQAARYTSELRNTLPEPPAQDTLTDPACTWLWRSLRQAEAVGLNSADMLQQAVEARSLADARNVARVLDSRIRRMIAHLPAAERACWADQVPQTSDPEMDRFMAELATAMDDRTDRIGEHVTQTQPAWAVRALGPVPDDTPNELPSSARSE